MKPYSCKPVIDYKQSYYYHLDKIDFLGKLSIGNTNSPGRIENSMDKKTQTLLLKLMKEQVGAVQAIVSEIKTMGDAFEYVVRATKKREGKSIAAPTLTTDEIAVLQSLCIKNNLTLLTRNLREHAESLHTGFTAADWGVAETGTLVIRSDSEDLRIATMLTDIHVVLLPLSRIRPDLPSLENELGQLMKASPGYLAFITGASRTADIERVLTIGVHGPLELHILVIEDEMP
jgi:L-lactate dehydrogenase complex protein LldG